MNKQDLIRILKRFRAVTDRRYQHKTDITLNTESKEIVGAINELDDNVLEINSKLDNIVNNFTTEQTDNSFIIKYNGVIIAEIPITTN